MPLPAAEIEPPEYMTIAEIAHRFRCSTDTVRRRIVDHTLKDLDWIDLFGRGGLRATKESVERYLQKRHSEMRKVLDMPLKRRK